MKSLLVLGKFKLDTIGSDPEFFIKHKTTGKIFPSFMFIEPEGTSLMDNEKIIIDTGYITFPIRSSLTEFFLDSKKIPGVLIYRLHKDNLLLEGNMPVWYSKRHSRFADIVKGLKQGANILAEKRGCRLECNSIGKFPKRFIDTPDGQNFGCRPYLKAWESLYHKDKVILEPCSVPRLSSRYRTAGFHIHIGYHMQGKHFPVKNSSTIRQFSTRFHRVTKDYDIKDSIKNLSDILITKLFDLMIVNPSRHVKLYPERVDNYGRFGSYRSKKYGVECRALGGYFSQDKYLPWVETQVHRLINHASELVKYDANTLFNLALKTKLQLKDKYYLDPKMYETFGLNYDKEIKSITSIEKTTHEKVKA